MSWLKTSPPHDPSVLNLDTVTPGLKIGVDTPQTFTYTSTDSNNKVSGTTTIPTPLPKTTKVTTEKSFHIRTMGMRILLIQKRTGRSVTTIIKATATTRDLTDELRLNLKKVKCLPARE